MAGAHHMSHIDALLCFQNNQRLLVPCFYNNEIEERENTPLVGSLITIIWKKY